MKELFSKISQALLLAPVMLLAVSSAAPAAVLAAPTCTPNVNTGGISSGADCAAPTNANNPLFGTGGVFVTIVNLLIFIVGAIAVLMLIVGGVRYVVSNGESSAVTNAKNTILYAIIGIIVSFLAFGAVQFVTSQLKPTTTTTTTTTP